MSKRVTAQDVAEKAGVSPTTVSFVLNGVHEMRIAEDTRNRVLQVAKELDYHPNSSAQKMARGRTNVIGLILRQDPEKAYADLFLPQVMQGVNSIARPAGYQILFSPLPPDDTGEEFSRLIQEKHVDGLIVSGPMDKDCELDTLSKNGANIILIGRLCNSSVPFVDINNQEAAGKVVSHLIEMGHRRIAFISNAPPIYASCRDRLAGYRQVLNQNGIKSDENLIFFADYTPESGYNAAQSMLSLNPLPTAVFVASDTVALGVVHALNERNIHIPQQMAVIGFDDIPISKFLNPPLSTVHSPAFSLGQSAASMLIQQLVEGRLLQEQVILHSRLIVRESSNKTYNHMIKEVIDREN